MCFKNEGIRRSCKSTKTEPAHLTGEKYLTNTDFEMRKYNQCHNPMFGEAESGGFQVKTKPVLHEFTKSIS